MLVDEGFESKLVSVIDNNCIDREVTQYKPDVVIIEAYWVVPEKFEVLCKLHPKVKWVIRNHSEVPFLANEGIAFDWTRRYVEYPNVFISCNAPRADSDFKTFIPANKEIFLPNFYPIDKPSNTDILREVFSRKKFVPKRPGYLSVGCPGAIRPLKNHLMQAVAAIRAAETLNLKLAFHVNGCRVENAGSNVVKNLIGLFQDAPYGTLIEEPWRNHTDFVTFLETMDVVTQVSFTETWNIVGCDAVSVSVPFVNSSEITWAGTYLKAPCDDSQAIAKKMILGVTQPKPLNAKLNLWKAVQPVPRIWELALCGLA